MGAGGVAIEHLNILAFHLVMTMTIITKSKYSNKAVTYPYTNDKTFLLESMQSKLERRGPLAVIGCSIV